MDSAEAMQLRESANEVISRFELGGNLRESMLRMRDLLKEIDRKEQAELEQWRKQQSRWVESHAR